MYLFNFSVTYIHIRSLYRYQNYQKSKIIKEKEAIEERAKLSVRSLTKTFWNGGQMKMVFWRYLTCLMENVSIWYLYSKDFVLFLDDYYPLITKITYLRRHLYVMDVSKTSQRRRLFTVYRVFKTFTHISTWQVILRMRQIPYYQTLAVTTISE